MRKLSGNQIRQMFLDYFASKGHMIEPGASLVPINDPTLLWINAGVAALKKYFDGREKPRNNRICNAQKSIRTNDIENVGKTARHHTFFEMLGNFSIGDYFKEDALKYAWEFLTSEEWIGFEKDRIYVTIYPDDDEAYDIWVNKIGLNPNRILKTYNNYWQIGEGPSGPDSEIFYDRGEKYDPQNLGEKLFFEELENDRYIEVWNVVFSQYDAKEGVERKDFKELPQKNIDTGMGLERLVALVQDAETNFDSDLFSPIIDKVKTVSSYPYDNEYKMAYRVIADHIRTVTFALADGALFSNEGRGYVLRRVIRRAIRYAHKIGIVKPYLFELVDVVVMIMKDFYPNISERKEFIKNQIKKEEETFNLTLKNGEKLLEEEILKANGFLKGEVIFKLYDTYGFPKEITYEIATEKGLEIDYEGFEKCMNRQKELARSNRNGAESLQNQSKDLLEYTDDFVFVGYEEYKTDATVKKLLKDNQFVESFDNYGAIIFDKSCFYAESGGQVADTGIIYSDNCNLKVLDVKKSVNGQYIHYVEVISGSIREGDIVTLEIDFDRRVKIRSNHSAVHLLHSALRDVLGNHISQAGSFVSDKYARFDFSHFEKITTKQLEEIENIVNIEINKATDIYTKVLPIELAKKENAIALFDEKYEDEVRVVCIGEFSKEFCGGTHAKNTAELSMFKIISEESVGSGIRRIQLATKLEAYEIIRNKERIINETIDSLKIKNETAIKDKLDSLISNNNALLKKYNDLENTYFNLLSNSFKNDVVNDVNNYLIKELNEGMDLKTFINNLKNKVKDVLVLIYQLNNEKINYLVYSDKNNFAANDILKEISLVINGKGGGKNDIAMGSSNEKDYNKLINKFKEIVRR